MNMKKTSLIAAAVFGSICTGSVALAQTNLAIGGTAPMVIGSSPHMELQQEATPPLNHFGLAYRMGLNMNVAFKRLGGFPQKTNPGPSTGTGQVHHYDDGYILPDSRGVDDHYTWNWGFNSSSQVSPGPGTPYGALALHNTSSPDTAHSTEDGDPQQGLELSYRRELGKFANEKFKWGIEAAFNWTDMTVHDNTTMKYKAARNTDTYSLDGLNPYQTVPPYPPGTPPNTPYQGTPGGGYPGGGGPLITDIPVSRTSTDIPGEATINGNYSTETDLYGVRLGPYLEMPLGDHFAVSLSAGLAVLVENDNFAFTETVSLPGLGTVSHSGSGHDNEWMAGWYVEAMVSYALNDTWGLFASAQYQDVGVFTQSNNHKQAQLQLNGSIFVSVGFSFSF